MENKVLLSNVLGECFANVYNSVFLDSDNILWKLINGVWIGKRSVYTIDNNACWIEDTTTDKIKSYWSGGESANYKEFFYR